MTRPIRARIDRDAFRHNLALARQAAAGARCWAVVKADAYGHGLLPMAQAIAATADGFALIEIEGAVALREAGLRHPILLLEGFYDAAELPLLAQYDLTPVLHAPWQVEALASAELPFAIPVVLKIETGMHRLGLRRNELTAALGRLAACGCASSITLMTHFATADGEPGIADQIAAFDAAASGRHLPRSLGNSAALLRYGERVGGEGNWARPGIMLYGATPCPEITSAKSYGLRPVMTLESGLIAVRKLAAGDRVGYGGSFVARAPMTVGVVACGYGDGYPRHAPTGTPVLVDGRRTWLVGRVSMDKLCVNLTDFANYSDGGTAHAAPPGGRVVLWGTDAASGAVLPADEVATAAGTIAYELFCALAGRVPIDYI